MYACQHQNLKGDVPITLWRDLRGNKNIDKEHFFEVTDEQVALWVLKGRRVNVANRVGDEPERLNVK